MLEGIMLYILLYWIPVFMQRKIKHNGKFCWLVWWVKYTPIWFFEGKSNSLELEIVPKKNYERRWIWFVVWCGKVQHTAVDFFFRPFLPLLVLVILILPQSPSFWLNDSLLSWVEKMSHTFSDFLFLTWIASYTSISYHLK